MDFSLTETSGTCILIPSDLQTRIPRNEALFLSTSSLLLSKLKLAARIYEMILAHGG